MSVWLKKSFVCFASCSVTACFARSPSTKRRKSAPLFSSHDSSRSRSKQPYFLNTISTSSRPFRSLDPHGTYTSQFSQWELSLSAHSSPPSRPIDSLLDSEQLPQRSIWDPFFQVRTQCGGGASNKGGWHRGHAGFGAPHASCRARGDGRAAAASQHRPTTLHPPNHRPNNRPPPRNQQAGTFRRLASRQRRWRTTATRTPLQS